MIAKCSHGSVSAEMAALRKDEALAKLKLEADQLAQVQLLAEQAAAQANVKFPEAA